jgi:ATP adenylyltransferase
MDQLWAPWRMANVPVVKPSGPASTALADCFLCQNYAQSAEHDRDNVLLLRTEHAQVVLNKFPYNNGHLLIAPVRHVADPRLLSPDELHDCTATLHRMMDALEACMRPDGLNCGLNLGSVAGAGLPGHVHWHLVPRWHGDANFMPVIADTKVIIQSLDACYALLREWLMRE